jgi:hypothetical protein
MTIRGAGVSGGGGGGSRPGSPDQEPNISTVANGSTRSADGRVVGSRAGSANATHDAAHDDDDEDTDDNLVDENGIWRPALSRAAPTRRPGALAAGGRTSPLNPSAVADAVSTAGSPMAGSPMYGGTSDDPLPQLRTPQRLNSAGPVGGNNRRADLHGAHDSRRTVELIAAAASPVSADRVAVEKIPEIVHTSALPQLVGPRSRMLLEVVPARRPSTRASTDETFDVAGPTAAATPPPRLIGTTPLTLVSLQDYGRLDDRLSARPRTPKEVTTAHTPSRAVLDSQELLAVLASHRAGRATIAPRHVAPAAGIRARSPDQVVVRPGAIEAADRMWLRMTGVTGKDKAPDEAEASPVRALVEELAKREPEISKRVLTTRQDDKPVMRPSRRELASREAKIQTLLQSQR